MWNMTLFEFDGAFIAALLGEISGDILLLGVAALMAFAVLLSRFRKRVARRRQLSAEQERQLGVMSELITSQNDNLQTLRERLSMLENYIDLLNNRQQQLVENRAQQQQRFEEAIECADLGLSDDEIADRVGITGSEARLIARLYSKSAVMSE